jgi:hypothetical protein
MNHWFDDLTKTLPSPLSRRELLRRTLRLTVTALGSQEFGCVRPIPQRASEEEDLCGLRPPACLGGSR